MIKKYSFGFTLLEVMMTLAIGAVVLSIGVPSFQNSISNNRKITSVNDLATALNLARNTAITRRVIVTVCKSDDGANCKTGGTSGDWTQGWMMFTNFDGDTNLDAGDGDELLRIHGKLPGSNISFDGNNNVTNQVSFSPKGLAIGSNGTITYCDSRGETHYSALVISVGGQIRSAIDETGDNVVDVEGVKVSCL